LFYLPLARSQLYFCIERLNLIKNTLEKSAIFT
jgi:hypothetical protein